MAMVHYEAQFHRVRMSMEFLRVLGGEVYTTSVVATHVPVHEIWLKHSFKDLFADLIEH